MNKILIVLLVGAAAAAQSACFTPPKTEKEFRKMMMDGKQGQVIQVTSQRPLADVKREVQDFARQCYNWTSKTTMSNPASRPGMDMPGGTFVSSWYSHWGKSRPGYDTFYVRDSTKAVNQVPGGFYIFIADFKSKGAGTVAEIYHVKSRYSTFQDDVQKIMAGKEPRCQN